MSKMLRIVFIAAALVAFLTVATMLFLWAVNSLAEAGGASFYIAHTVWNYWVPFVFLAVTRNSSFSFRSSGK